MRVLDTSAYQAIGETSNSTFFLGEPGVLVGVMNEGARDDARTAKENSDFYHEYFREHGAGMLVYSLERITDQSLAARHTYRDEADTNLIYCVGLLVGSLFSRAVGTFYLGIARPRGMPVKVSGSIDQLLSWGRPICEKRRGR